MTTRTPECHCLRCGARLNAAGAAPGVSGVPEPGNLTLCLKCGAVMVFDWDLTVRGMTEPEMDELCSDAEAMYYLGRLVQRIHMIPQRN